MNVEALLRTIAQIPEDLQEILSKVRLLPSIVTTLSKMESRIMSTVADLQAKLTELNTTIADEHSEVTSKIETLTTTVEELKAAIAAQPEVDLSAEVAAVDQAIAAVKGIYEPEATPVVEPETPVTPIQ